MAHKKGASSSRNGRDSNAQYLGVKRYGGQTVNAGEILQMLLAAGGVRVVNDEVQLGRAVSELLADPAARQRMGAQALQVVTANRGSSAQVIELLVPLLERRPA